MPTRPVQPDRGVALCDIPLLDADGIEIPLVGARIEQIAVDKARGAVEFRLNQQGAVVGRAAHLVCVRFDGEYHHTELSPKLVRLVATADSGQRA